jgi:phosphoglycolate phosphatase
MDLIIFDLDGTLIDSKLDLATSVNEMLTVQRRPPLPNETIYGYIGKGVRHLIERSLGKATPSEVDRSLEVFGPIYKSHLLDTTRPFAGVRPALEALQGQSTLAVLTNKPHLMSVAVLEGLDLDSYFEFIFGGDSFPNRKPDPIGIETLLNETGVARERALMVGDSRIDYETARNASIPICMVTYGLGASEIENLDPDYVVDNLCELSSFIIPIA